MQEFPLLELKELYQNQYVSHDDLADFMKKYNINLPTETEIIRQEFKYLRTLQFIKFNNYRRSIKQIHKYLNCRDKLNQSFIKKEQKKSYMVEGRSLDPQQIAAVVACEDAELILAPAGSGKTASLLAKIDYLINNLEIRPEDILIIAFTNKVVDELKARVKQTTVEIRTFHSLGNKIIKKKLKNYRLITGDEIGKFFHNTIEELCQVDRGYADRYEKYLNCNDAEDELFVLLNVAPCSRNLHERTIVIEELFISLLGFQKAERVTLNEMRRRIEDLQDPYSRQKSLNLYYLYAPVVEKYDEFLKTQRLYDFADMLILAADIVEKMPRNSFNYRYILVDEAQDLSVAKYLLLKAILKKCGKVKLFAVGDDWQSIYRFAGSNLKVLDNFEEIFKRKVYKGLIELTYRFGQPTARLSNKFIQKNPHQSRKKVVSRIKRWTPIEVRLNPPKQPYGVPQDYETVDGIIQDLYHQYKEDLFKEKIQIISRYNRDVYRLVGETNKSYQKARLANISETEIGLEWKLPKTEKKLKIPFCSMHKAKGITRDIIIVINANSGNYGVPAIRKNDTVAEILLAPMEDYPYAEERRLFYVAITRAKKKTIIVADALRVSPFVFEISPKLKGVGVRVCPECRRGIMLERRRRSDGKIYYSCSNYVGGCRHIER